MAFVRVVVQYGIAFGTSWFLIPDDGRYTYARGAFQNARTINI